MGKYSLALQAQENMVFDIFPGPKPEKVELNLESICNERIIGSSAQSKRKRNDRNTQQKMNWQNNCHRLIQVSIMCGDKPWLPADLKPVSSLYLSIGVEGLSSKNSHIMVDTLNTSEFWKTVEDAFIRTQKITCLSHHKTILNKNS